MSKISHYRQFHQQWVRLIKNNGVEVQGLCSAVYQNAIDVCELSQSSNEEYRKHTILFEDIFSMDTEVGPDLQWMRKWGTPANSPFFTISDAWSILKQAGSSIWFSLQDTSPARLRRQYHVLDSNSADGYYLFARGKEVWFTAEDKQVALYKAQAALKEWFPGEHIHVILDGLS